MGTSRIYPLTFSLRLCIRSKRECKNGIWLSALARNMSHPLLGNSLFVSSAWKYGNCQACLGTRVNILSLMLASTRSLRERSEKPAAGQIRDNSILIFLLWGAVQQAWTQTQTHTYTLETVGLRELFSWEYCSILLQLFLMPITTVWDRPQGPGSVKEGSELGTGWQRFRNCI